MGKEHKRCPFCGRDKIKIETKQALKRYDNRKRILNVTASVRCMYCHARGPTMGGEVEGGYSEEGFLRKDNLKRQALEAWVWRAEDGE